MSANASVITAAAVALVVGYLVGRVRPWQRLGDWAEDQVRFTGAWVRGGRARQAAVVLVHVLVRPRTSWHIMRAPAHETRVPVPERDPNWISRRTTGDKGGPA
ncbi:hypothetical protein [Streptomyces lincolnensis]|uniref:hypothetical protein n=1 Tax=Streptomyces lincolnensis TaxID=1915 RepID=UPI0037D67E1C